MIATLLLPEKLTGVYIAVIEPLALLIGGIMAILVARLYAKQLKTTFVFLAIYLTIYALALVIIPLIQNNLGDYFGIFVLSVQLVNYAALVLFCVYLLKVVDIRKLDVMGWVMFAATFLVSTFLAVYPMLFYNGWDLTLNTLSFAIVRIMDALLIIILMPVIWLYIQHLKAQQKQSLTFTLVIAGIVISTLFDYLFQTLILIFPNLLPTGSHIVEVVPDMLYIFGYLVIVVGLYAHLKQDEWGFQMIDKMLG
ncbi:MAG: hypothetical protein PHY28_00250 [Dehalococcoidales bacterium]|nr:hypothetical protein [Dehalococcoidales bacterium]